MYDSTLFCSLEQVFFIAAKNPIKRFFVNDSRRGYFIKENDLGPLVTVWFKPVLDPHTLLASHQQLEYRLLLVASKGPQ